MSWRSKPLESWSLAVLCLTAVFLTHFSRILFGGEVISPHDNEVEVGEPASTRSDRPTYRYFSDLSSAFIPELACNLSSNRKAWLNTWNPHVQLGRATLHLSGLSPAFGPTNLLSCFTSNPFILHTSLILLTVGMTAGFFLLFLRSLGLHPAASVCAALGLAFTTFVSYQLCFVTYLGGICWPVCLLWLITEFTRKPSWLVAFGLALATHCLLMTAYPQLTVLAAYMVVPFALLRLVQMPGTRADKGWRLLAMLGGAGLGIVASLPVYLDLLLVAKEASRLAAVRDDFFLKVLPPLDLKGVGTFLAALFDWSWLGHPLDPKYPVPFNGLKFTPVFATLIWLSLLLKNRRAVLLWQLLLGASLVGAIFPPVYLFAVHHLGFGFSRISLLFGGIIPGFVLSGIVLDAIIRGELRLTIPSGAWLLAPLGTVSVIALLFWRPLALDHFAIAAAFLLVGTLGAAIYWRSLPALLAIVVASTFLYGRPLILSRPLQRIHTSSELTDAIAAQTADGTRFAIADKAMQYVLRSNQEVIFGLRSVNSYDSLSSRRYQDQVLQWNAAGATTYGRYFKILDAGLALPNPEFQLSNVRTIVSKRALPTDHLRSAGEVRGFKLYETITEPVGLRQTSDFRALNTFEVAIDPSKSASQLESRRVEELNDFQKISVTPSPQETLLFLSQQYHRAWQAESGGQSLRTVIVNRFYQGVVLPRDTSEVELTFRPFVLWSWVPQLFFATAGAFLLLRALRRRKT